LNALYSSQNFRERLKLWVINQITYWNAYADVIGSYKIQRSKDSDWKITETVVWAMPTIDILSWTEIFFDSRFKMLEDMPWIIRRRKSVRLLDLISDGKYFNLDKVKKMAGTKYSDIDQYSNLIFQVTWVQWVQCWRWIEVNSLSLEESQIRYSITGKAINEKLYKVTTVNQAVIIWIEEITTISIVDIKGHEDPETANSIWMVAPILGITDELNFQKNAQATAISKSLNRSYYWSPESWVDPSQLISDRPWNIIMCMDWVEQAERNLKEQDNRELPAQYFSNINDYNRDIQALTHTTDVSQPGGQGALTNTATGARISFFESNSVIAEFRKNFERWVTELSYKILDWTANNIDKDIVLKKTNSKEFLKININAIKEAVKRYDIIVEANSSSFDDVENRRADAIALKNLGIEAVNSGANVDLNYLFKRVFSTFEQVDIDKLMPKVEEWGWDIESLLWWSGQSRIPAWKEWAWPAMPTTPAELTSAVAGWDNLLGN
jgi:SHS2 domain-containing protein